MRAIIQMTFVLTVFLFISSSSFAQTIDLGARIGTETADIDREFFGVDVRIGLPALPVVLNPTFDYYGGGWDSYQLSGNALLDLGSAALPNISPYVGAGLGITDHRNDTDIAVNALGGASISAGPVSPFAQIQLTFLGEHDLVAISLGVLIRVSG